MVHVLVSQGRALVRRVHEMVHPVYEIAKLRPVAVRLALGPRPAPGPAVILGFAFWGVLRSGRAHPGL